MKGSWIRHFEEDIFKTYTNVCIEGVLQKTYPKTLIKDIQKTLESIYTLNIQNKYQRHSADILKGSWIRHFEKYIFKTYAKHSF